LATDVVGLIGAMTGVATGGVGSAVAVGSGFASMGMDAIADFTDDKVSAGQAWKNLGLNAGLAVGAAFGAKAPKILKGVIKIVPKAMTAIGVAGITLDPEVQKTASKIASGKDLNINDWRNVSIILRTVTGIGTMHATKRGATKAAKKAQAEVNAELKKNLATNPNERTITSEDGSVTKTISKQLYDDVAAKLNPKGKTPDQYKTSVEEATKLLKDSNQFTDSEISILMQDVKGQRGWNPFKKGFWKPESTKELKLVGDETQLKNLPKDVRADVYAQLMKNAKKAPKAKTKLEKLMNTLDKGVETITFGKIKQ